MLQTNFIQLLTLESKLLAIDLKKTLEGHFLNLISVTIIVDNMYKEKYKCLFLAIDYG
jgi:hypothetical protein